MNCDLQSLQSATKNIRERAKRSQRALVSWNSQILRMRAFY